MRQVIAVASPPFALIAATTSWQGSRLRPEITTLPPASAKISAIARPMPRDEPVMTATLPVRSKRERVIRFYSYSYSRRHPREGGGPGQPFDRSPWIPAFAGMTRLGAAGELSFLFHQRIAQDADAGDLDLADIAMLEVTRRPFGAHPH